MAKRTVAVTRKNVQASADAPPVWKAGSLKKSSIARSTRPSRQRQRSSAGTPSALSRWRSFSRPPEPACIEPSGWRSPRPERTIRRHAQSHGGGVGARGGLMPCVRGEAAPRERGGCTRHVRPACPVVAEALCVCLSVDDWDCHWTCVRANDE